MKNKPNQKSLYNLSDIIRFKKERGLNFQGSIAEEYLTKHDNSYKIDFKCLQEIVQKRRTKIADDDTFVIHVRLFDVIDKVPDLDVFPQIIKNHNLHVRFKNCLLFYGNHRKGIADSKIKESENYLKKLKNKIEDLKLSCKLVSQSADEDFICLATAKCYIAGYRGFEWLAASINPNEVIWDIQDPPIFPWLLNQDFKEGLIAGYEFYKNNIIHSRKQQNDQ
jgi:hypothetical protein